MAGRELKKTNLFSALPVSTKPLAADVSKISLTFRCDRYLDMDSNPTIQKTLYFQQKSGMRKNMIVFYQTCYNKGAFESDEMSEINGLLKPSSDFVFANLFGVEKHKKALICLLNAILKGKQHIESITLLNPQHKILWYKEWFL